jgi:2-C-methyl-D-erythritol 4-phosphate cytidylyltransferase
MTVSAVVPAAGSGTRLGAGAPKAFVPLGGVPIVVRAVDGLLASGAVDEVLVAVPAALVDHASVLFADRPVTVLVGGAERTETVRLALDHLLHDSSQRARDPSGDGSVVLVHDAARPLTPPALVAAVVAAVRAGSPAVIPVLPLADTVKRVSGSIVESTVDRSTLRAVQTPQGFTPEALRAAYAAAGDIATDDAGLVERAGGKVTTIPGDPLAFKVTTPWDLRIASLLVEDA